MANSLNKKQTYEVLRAQLEIERATFTSHWRELSDYILPRRLRANMSDVNKGDKRNKYIIDSTATAAARVLRSGMMAGITSPARPWFKLTTPDPSLDKFGPVRNWLADAQKIMSTSYLRSNLYNTLPSVYGDLGVFGTSAMYVEEDFTGEVLWTQSFPIGSYMIAKDYKGKVNTFIRDFRMTVQQLVEQFGVTKNGKADWSNFSTAVRSAWDKGQYQTWIDVCHVIAPNIDYDKNKLNSKFKRFSSCYYERGVSGQQKDSAQDNTFLRESGYENFPVLCPRWEVTGEDVYATSCPGMEALGDIKQLQHGEKRIMEAIDKMIRPPMIAPTSMKNQVVTQLPGDTNYSDADQPRGLRPALEVNFRVQEMQVKQQEIRRRIDESFFKNIFLMIDQMERAATATEVNERKQEKMLMLGPVLEYLNQDLLDPLTDIAFNYHINQNLLPPPPPELEGMNLRVEYVSIMAQAQKMLGISGVDRFSGFISGLGQVDAAVYDKVKSDELVNVYADMTAVPPNIIRSDDEVAALRDTRAKQQQAAAKQAQAAQMAQTAQTLSQTPVNQDGDTALSAMLTDAGVN